MNSLIQTSRIREAIRSRDPDLLHRAEQLIARASQLLPHTLSTFPSGTEHGPPHTVTVEQIASMLVTDALLSALSDDELFFLLLGFHYHDLGMAGTEVDNATAAGREQARREHAVSIARKIVESRQALGFEDENEAAVLGDICRGHRPNRNADGRASWDDLDKDRILGPGRSIRLRLLSAIVYASDELHIGADRAPERVAQWKQIVSEESRPHWERHAAVTGPALINDQLTFDVRPKTPALEEDLRRHVLRKALLAVDDLNRQAEAEGLATPIRRVLLRWQRSHIWQLLMLRCLADERPLGEQQIVERVLTAFQNMPGDRTDLSGLCDESNVTTEALRAEIGRTTAELIQDGRLSPGTLLPPCYMLASTGRQSRWALDLARSADDMDRRCTGPYAADHEFTLLRASYGQRYVADAVTPAVRQGYSVDLALEKADSRVRSLIEKSPTACRLVSDIAPPPSGLVKRDLLAGGVLFGFLVDVLRDPELLLDPDTRKAAKTLARDMTDQLPKFLTFLEELALIGGWTLEQISGVLLHPAETQPQNPLDTEAHVTISHTIPRTYPMPSTGFAYLALAGIRSGTNVSLLNTPESRLQVDVAEALSPKNAVESAPVMVSIGPGHAVPAARLDMRCKIEVDTANCAVHLLGYGLGEPEATSLPIVVEMSPPRRFPQETTGKATFSPRPNCMTVGDLATYQQMAELISRKGAQLKLTVAKIGQSLAQMSFPPTKSRIPTEFVQPDLLAALLKIDTRIPLPLFVSHEDAVAITSAAPADAPTVYRQIIDRLRDDKRDITTLYLVRDTASGVAYQEEFLGFLPGVTFNSPQLDDPAKQEFLDEQWKKREQVMGITCYMVQPADEIAQAVIQWAEDSSPPFPGIHVWKDASVPHHCKAISQTDFLPAIDRQWYRELPMRVTVRPLTREEELQIEVAYWQSVGDTRRAQLAEERLQAVNASVSQPETLFQDTPSTPPLLPPQVDEGHSQTASEATPAVAENGVPESISGCEPSPE